MKRLLLSTAAVLVIGLGAVHAQSDRQERGGASAQPRSEESRPAAQPGDTQRAPQRAQSNQRSPSGDRGAAGAENAGRDSAQRPAESGRAAGDARDGASDRADRSRDRAPRDAAGADRDRPSSRESSRSRDSDRDRSASERRQDRASDRASRRDRDATESRRSSDTGRTERDRAASDRTDRTDRSASTGRSERGEVSLSGEQRQRVSQRFAARIDSMNVRSVSRSSVSVSVGATIPSAVRLYAVPSDVVAIYPRFRGYQFVLVEDEIVIVEPRTRRIVTTIERSGGGAVASRSSRSTTGAADAGARIRLSPEERRVIRTTVVQEPACRYEQRIDFFIGIPLPSTAKVCEFPERVVSEVPEIRRYRYVVRDEEVVVVDPDEHRVIEVIR
ncbi:MAG: DUF1236 domain-containing protein [Xanthobacteraceae bacterium]|nr:DUF1236 domain-containing protein [Xanthobacteraceae bacterium]